MKNLAKIPHFPKLENLVQILMRKTQNQNPLFFRILVAYYFSKVAATMRVNIKTHDRGTIPVNMYGINLATSGAGKGFSTNIVEEQVINKFEEHFIKYTFPSVSEKNIAKIAIARSNKIPGSDPDAIRLKVEKEFEQLGHFVFSFSEGTSPAVKQMRHKLLMANCGSVNLEIDEIGSYMTSNTDVLNTFLELFDVGKVKSKLTKNTADNTRNEEIKGRTPTCMMLFGTQDKLLMPGSREEHEFFNWILTGYGRRCFFGYSKYISDDLTITPEQLYILNTDKSIDTFMTQLSTDLGKLADEINFGLTLEMSKDVAILVTEYQLNCRRAALKLPQYQEVKKAELQHRYYKALKLAGAYAFVDGSKDITELHVLQAIKLAEESGVAFNQMLAREKPHKALAKFIVEHEGELTVVDLMDNLPFFKGSESIRRDLLTRAVAFGYKNNMVIKRNCVDGIEFFNGESLEETNINELKVSYSKFMTEGYTNAVAPLNKLNRLVNATGLNYCANHFKEGYRHSKNVIEGFNLLMLDVDNGLSLDTAKMLLKDYTAIFATTKSHTPQDNRFRIILPLSHVVKLDAENYVRFMENVFNWLPFSVDDQTKDSARKWQSFKGEYYVQDGKLIDALKFIPNTSEEEKQSKQILDNQDLGNLERWFYTNINVGNRNHQLLKYALALIDSGKSVDEIRITIKEFNERLQYPISDNELNSTVMVTVINRINKNP